MQKDVGVNKDKAVARSTALGIRFVDAGRWCDMNCEPRYSCNDACVRLIDNEGNKETS